ncbi:MAG: anhydro-N-acetylmuramic acid kinase [Elusimicrobiales bacterium]|nr:anhydro-N-acetylmuramic acid kinase [Elusimicrobiales bacterium]
MIKRNKFYVIGLMSGTSCDGLSIAYCEVSFKPKNLKVLKFENYSYSKSFQINIMKAREFKTSDIINLSFKLGNIWADMVYNFIKKFKIKRIDLISSHGQTIYHDSTKKVTFQIGEVEFITRKFNVPVAYDFRIGDIVFGGEGAPLIPFFDEFLFGDNDKIMCLLNIGGISNITITGGGIKTFGFDTGPGNSLMDWAVRIYTKDRESYDKNGFLASKGVINYSKIERFMKNPFFHKKPPKSLDREEFGIEFIKKSFDFKKEKIEDILATLNYFTALCVKYSVDKFVKAEISEVVVSGGGSFNNTLMNNLQKLFKDIPVNSILKYNIHPLAKEAAGFALLGACRVAGIPSNCPNVTGAKKRVVLGKLSLP